MPLQAETVPRLVANRPPPRPTLLQMSLYHGEAADEIAASTLTRREFQTMSTCASVGSRIASDSRRAA